MLHDKYHKLKVPPLQFFRLYQTTYKTASANLTKLLRKKHTSLQLDDPFQLQLQNNAAPTTIISIVSTRAIYKQLVSGEKWRWCHIWEGKFGSYVSNTRGFNHVELRTITIVTSKDCWRTKRSEQNKNKILIDTKNKISIDTKGSINF